MNSTTKLRMRFLLGAATMTALCGASAQAQTLAEYIFETNAPAGSTNAGSNNTSGARVPNVTGANTTVSALNIPATGTRLLNQTFFSGFHSYRQDGNGSLTNTLAGAITENTYAGFTVTPSANFALTMTEISTVHRAQNAGAAAFQNVSLMSSITGFGATNTPLYTRTNFDSNNTAFDTVNLSVLPAFTSVTAPVEFRWYFWHPTNSGNFQARGFGNWNNNVFDAIPNNLILRGTTSAAVVPEAGTVSLALAGLSLLGGVVLRRRAR